MNNPPRWQDPIRGILNSCRFALRGIAFAARAQRNIRIHFIAAALALFTGFLLRFDRLEMVLLILTVSLVVMGELLNTALEYLLNLLEARDHPTVRAVKDIAAGAILMAVIGSIGAGLFLFGPRFLGLLGVN